MHDIIHRVRLHKESKLYSYDKKRTQPFTHATLLNCDDYKSLILKSKFLDPSLHIDVYYNTHALDKELGVLYVTREEADLLDIYCNIIPAKYTNNFVAGQAQPTDHIFLIEDEKKFTFTKLKYPTYFNIIVPIIE